MQIHFVGPTQQVSDARHLRLPLPTALRVEVAVARGEPGYDVTHGPQHEARQLDVVLEAIPLEQEGSVVVGECGRHLVEDVHLDLVRTPVGAVCVAQEHLGT